MLNAPNNHSNNRDQRWQRIILFFFMLLAIVMLLWMSAIDKELQTNTTWIVGTTVACSLLMMFMPGTQTVKLGYFKATGAAGILALGAYSSWDFAKKA